MSDSAPRAVFLSYAREDTVAARRIAEALRSSGIEVWFDENELRGGDAWDQKIRRQIRECGLFLPVVSTRTEERGEGYFRREWKLAAERTHDMAEGVPFLVPVVIDETSEAGAAVPEQFLQVQWTRLPGALPTPQFVEQVKRLLAAPRKPAASAAKAASRDTTSAPAKRTSVPGGMYAALGLAALALLVFLALRPVATKPSAPTPPTAAPKPAPAEVPVREVTDKSIAVLPFANLSPDKENEFFADGMHEDILTSLGRIRELRVVSRFSVMEYRGKTGNLREIARKLGVAYVLEGSVRRAGGQVRVTGQLIRAAADEHIWVEDYTKELTATNVFEIQSDIAKKIAASLQAVISPEEKKLIERRPTQNAAAYDLFLRFRELYHRTDRDNTKKEQAAILEAAVQLDPQFAMAWSRLGGVHLETYFLQQDYSPARVLAGKKAIDTAVRLAPNAPETLAGLGYYYYRAHRDYAKALEEFRKALELEPGNPDVLISLGWIYRRQGRWLDALEYLQQTAKLEPGNLYVVKHIANLYEAGRRYDDAIAQRRRVLSAAPSDVGVAFHAARAAWYASGSANEVTAFFAGLTAAQADSREGLAARRSWAFATGRLAEYQRLARIKPNDWPDDTEFRPDQGFESAVVSATLGQRAEARAKIANLAELRARVAAEPTNYQAWRDLAEIEALMGNASEAVRCARKAVELLPEARDALVGPRLSSALAFVYAWTGDKDRALAEYARLLRVPFSGLNIHEMRTSPYYFPLRGDPRFEALLNDPKNNAPLF